MRTNNEIINEVLKDGFLQEIVKNISKGSKHESDLFQEVCLDILEFDNEKLNKSLNEKWIKYLVISITRNKMNSNTSSFYRKFKRNEMQLIDTSFNLSSEYNEAGQESFNNEMNRKYNDELQFANVHQNISLIEEIIENMHWYDKEIAQMYWKLGPYNMVDGVRRDKSCKKSKSSYRRLEKMTGIDHNAIALTIIKVIEGVKNEL